MTATIVAAATAGTIDRQPVVVTRDGTACAVPFSLVRGVSRRGMNGGIRIR